MSWDTCIRCNRDLYPRLCRRTDEGWTHVVCRPLTVAFMRCGVCHKAVAPTRDKLCADCKAAETSELELFGGAWIHHGMILRWEAAS